MILTSIGLPKHVWRAKYFCIIQVDSKYILISFVNNFSSLYKHIAQTSNKIASNVNAN